MNRSQSSAGSLSPSRSPNHTLKRASSREMRASLQSPLQALALEQAVATELMLAMDSKPLTVLKRDWAALTDGFAHSLGIDDFLYLISRHTAPIPHVAARPQAVLIAALTELFHEIDSACANCGMIAWSDFSRQLMHAAQAGDSAYTKARGRLGPRSSRPLCRPLPLLPHTRRLSATAASSPQHSAVRTPLRPYRRGPHPSRPPALRPLPCARRGQAKGEDWVPSALRMHEGTGGGRAVDPDAPALMRAGVPAGCKSRHPWGDPWEGRDQITSGRALGKRYICPWEGSGRSDTPQSAARAARRLAVGSGARRGRPAELRVPPPSHRKAC